MPPAQHGMTESDEETGPDPVGEPAEGETPEEAAAAAEGGPEREGGFLRFLRRKETAGGRSDTEWVDTLVAQREPEPEPEEESPFQAGAEAEPEEPPELPPPPATDEFVTERQWRRRQHDEMDQIHSFIDRIIGTEHDPVVRHRKLSGLGVARRAGPTRRDLANVSVEGLEQELMIAFTFPREELRSAKVVYETEGGYVIEVLRAVGGDERNQQRQYYTVSRMGSVAHTLDKLRAQEIERRVQRDEARAAQRSAEPPRVEAEPPPAEPEPGEPEEAPEAETPAPGAAPPSEADEPEPAGGAESEERQRGGFTRFLRREKEEPEVPGGAAEPAPAEETEPPEKRGLRARLLRKDRAGETEPERSAEPEADQAPDEGGKKKGALRALSPWRRKDKGDGEAEAGEGAAETDDDESR